ncbi:F-box/LRR-repeat protein At5g63520 isoform X2 [Aristolochia californica]|uniref:F-box/LRR-repeat protein At5g63520 isoform X2 n=1 Tax=Aristolochia californica TaxID=171875 RepID=UPI0035DAAEA1
MEPRKLVHEGTGDGRILALGVDLLHNILSRLPAVSFSRAAATCRTFRKICTRVLNRPKLLSALSLNTLLQDAVEEAFEKVLSEPIRPHFVIACIGRKFNLSKAHKLIQARLGDGIPVVTCLARGIIGKEVITGEFVEVQWDPDDSRENGKAYNSSRNIYRGILLIVGFVPGLKVDAVPLKRAKKRSERGALVESFLSEIKSFTSSASGSTSPLGILLFSDNDSDMRYVVGKMDEALGRDTIIAGDERGCFLFSGGEGFTNAGGSEHNHEDFDAVGLVFATDRGKSHDIGEIHFNLLLSSGISPVGPTYKAASVRVSDDSMTCFTWLTATREGSLERLDGQRIIADLENEMANGDGADVYIGVLKRRKCSATSRRKSFCSAFAFHAVNGGDEEYLFVEGDGIRTGDRFRCYVPNVETALLSRDTVFEELKHLKTSGAQSTGDASGPQNANRMEQVFGGLMFTCYGRGESFYGKQNVDSSVFLENFPNTPMAGVFCAGEIGCGPSTKPEDCLESNPGNIFLHVYSAVYVLMSYSPKEVDY